MRPSSGSPEDQLDTNSKIPSSNGHHEHHHNNAENAAYTPPTLIPPRILPLLHDLAMQMVQAGHQQQILKIYRLISISLILFAPEDSSSSCLSVDSVPRESLMTQVNNSSSSIN